MVIDEKDEEEPKGQDFFDWAMGEIEDTRTYVKEHYFPQWEKKLRLFLGDHWSMYSAEDKKYKSSDNPAREITDNQIGPYIMQLASFVVSKQTQISVKPTKPQEVTSAILQQVAANYEWRRRKFHPQVKKCFIDSMIFGYGVGEIGYNLEIDESATPDKDGMLDYREYIKADAPYFRRIFPTRFIYDLTAPEKNLESARWCGEVFYQSPHYVLRNKRYDESVRSDIRTGKEKPEAVSDDHYNLSQTKTPEAMKKFLTMTRFYDKKFKRVYIFCKGVKKPLLNRPWPWDYIDGFPIKFLPFIEHPDDWYPIDFSEWIEDDQFELNRSRTAMCHFRRTHTGGSVLFKGVLDKGTRAGIARGDYVVEGLQDDQEPIPLQYAPFPQEQFIMDGIFQRSMERKSGLSDITQGASSPGRRAATEIRTRAQFTMMRIDGYIENVDTFNEAIAVDLIKHIKANYDLARMHMIAGPIAQYWGQVMQSVENAPASWVQQYPNGEYWVEFSKRDIEGEFDVEVESTAKPKVDPQMELANLTQFQQDCLSVAQLAVSLQADPGNIAGINFIELLRKKADVMGIKDASNIINRLAVIPPPPQQQTGLDAQMQQQAAPAPAPMEQQQMMGEAVDPASALLGQILGGGNGGQV